MIDYAALDGADRPELVRPRSRPAGPGPARLPARGSRVGRGEAPRLRRARGQAGRSQLRPRRRQPAASSCATTAGPTRSTRSCTTRRTSTRSGRCGSAATRGGFARDEAERGRPVPGIVERVDELPAVAGRHRSRVQPRHDLGRRRARRRVRAARRPRLAARRPARRRRSSPGSTDRCSSPSATAAPTSAAPCTAPLATSATGACSSTARSGSARTSTARRSSCSPVPRARPTAPPGSGSTSCRRDLDDGSRNGDLDAAPEAEARARRACRPARSSSTTRSAYALRPRRGRGRRRAVRCRRAQPHDGDGQRLAVRGGDDGARHRPSQLPRERWSGRTTGRPRAGCLVDLPLAARAARRPPRRARGRVRARLRVRGGAAVRRRRPPAPDPRPRGEGAPVPLRRRGGRRSRSSSTAATATARTGASPASCATRSATRSGRAARRSASSTCCARSGATRAHEAVFARIDGVAGPAPAMRPAYLAEAADARAPRAAPSSSAASTSCPRSTPTSPRHARGPAHGAARRDATSGALLLEQAVGDPHKGLVALRFARRHLTPGGTWNDSDRRRRRARAARVRATSTRHRREGGRVAPRLA